MNNNPQVLNDNGYVLAPQCYWHQRVEKVTYRVRADGQRVNIKKRIPTTALPDDIHPSQDVCKRWFDAMDRNFMSMIDRLPNPYSWVIDERDPANCYGF